MKRNIDVWQYAPVILQELGKGVLVTAGSGKKANPMTIGWGTLGIQWGKPIFTVFIRESRHTKALLDETPEFTVNIPYGQEVKEILKVCGTKSGRDINKFEALGLTPETSETVSVPGIRQLPLTLECKIIYQQKQDAAAIAPENLQRYYAPGTANEGDIHTAYYGQITAAYIIE